MDKKKYDVVFIGGLYVFGSGYLTDIASSLSKNINSIVLTYRKTNIKDTYSYEEFLEDNYEKINQINEIDLAKRYKNVNLYSSIVVERLITDSCSITPETVGTKKFTIGEINFIIKSFTLFLEEFIMKTKIVISGHDNIFSLLSIKVAQQWNIKSYSFDLIDIIQGNDFSMRDNSNFHILDTIKLRESPDNIMSYLKKLKEYDNREGIKDYYKNHKQKGARYGLAGVVSNRIFEISYWQFILFGYKTSNKKINKYMNLDRPSFLKKLNATFYRLVYKYSSQIYFRLFADGIPNEPFVYFPIKLQPESMVNSFATLYSNQIATIEMVSKSLPLGYKLVVKWHTNPMTLSNIENYKKVQSLPNVVLVDNKISGKEVMKKAELIIGYGGTGVFEAIVFGKKTILLGDFFFTKSKLIRVCKDLNNLFNEIHDFLDYNLNKEELEKELVKMYTYVYEYTFSSKNLAKDVATNIEDLIRVKTT